MGGTGVTPAYQLISHLLTPPTSTNSSTPVGPIPKLTLIYASPSPSEILIKPELDHLTSLSPSNSLSIKYLVSSASSEQAKAGWFDFGASSRSKEVIKGLQKDGIEVGRIGKENLLGWIGRGDSAEIVEKKRVVIVCGPEGYVISLFRLTC